MKSCFTNILWAFMPPVIKRRLYCFYRAIKDRYAARKLKDYSCLHLACGPNILEGWANVDFNRAKQIISLDLTRPFPVESNSIQFIFCEHFLEHITLDQGKRFLKECYRILKNEGVLRISTPGLRAAIDLYSSGEIDRLVDTGWCPETPCQMFNEAMRLWGHQFVYDSEELKKVLTEAGFKHISELPWRKSAYPQLCELECRPFNGEIIMEARK